MKCNGWPVAVCSWSLQTDVDGVAEAMRHMAIEHVNLALKPCFREGGDDYLAAVSRQNWTITATTIGFFQEDYSSLASIRATGGIVPDEYWTQNRQMVVRAAEITAQLLSARLLKVEGDQREPGVSTNLVCTSPLATSASIGVGYLTMHAGFLESDDAAQAAKVRDRLRCLADAAGEQGIVLLLETGQESAECLQGLLEELNHPALGVNYDPANMILYDKGDPIRAVRRLGPWIKHLHVKDALRTRQPGTWGTEVPWGEGEVGPGALLKALKEIRFAGALAIEREAGDNRSGDIRLAAARLAEAGHLLELGAHP